MPADAQNAPVEHPARQPVRCRRLDLPDGETATLGERHAFELCVLIEGSAIHDDGPALPAPSNAVTERIGPGTVLVAGPGHGHALEQPRGLVLYTVSFRRDWLMDDLRASWGQEELLPPLWSAVLLHGGSASRTTRVSVPVDTLRAAMRELEDLRAAEEGTPPSLLYLKASLFKLMALISAAHQTEPNGSGDSATRSLPIARLLDDIEQSLADGRPFRVIEAAASAAMSSDHLCRLFRDATGETPRAYYQRRRAQAAARLLLDPARSIAGIAKQLGYCDAAHFCNTFKRVHGESPSAFRKRRHGR